ncbi:VOC family protein [Halobacillus sp. H74]|uniref:VOC family protein n=1 Tax=Halobacillus sp. H74 TaxID=3457436 RepID=UPI003FCD3FA1
MSIEVDDFENIRIRIKEARVPFEYGPVNELRGGRRFFLRDPFGKLLNILSYL